MPEALSKVELVGSCARLQNAAGLGRFVSAFAIPKHPGDPCDPWFCGTSIVFVIFVSFMVKSGSLPARSQKSFSSIRGFQIRIRAHSCKSVAALNSVVVALSFGTP